MTDYGNSSPRNHVCRTSMRTLPSQGREKIEVEIDLVREYLIGANAVVDMCIRAAADENSEVLNALTLVSPVLAKALAHIDQLELAVAELGESRPMQEATSTDS